MADSGGNSAPTMLGILWAEAGVAALVLLLRYYTRLKITRVIGWDDYIMLIALVLGYAGISLLTTSVSYGFGKHQHVIPSQNLVPALMYHWIAQPFLVTGILVARISITVLLIRLFPTKELLRRFLIVITVINTVSTVIPVTLIFACTPVQRQWDESLPGHCVSPHLQAAFAITKAGLSAITDLSTALWPIAIIWKLHMRLRDKAALGFIFGLSLLAMVGSIVEACFLGKLGSRSDVTYDLPFVYIWIGTQTNLVIITGSIPTLRPLFQRSFYQNRSSPKAVSTSAEESKRKQWLPINDSVPAEAGISGTITNITANDEEDMTSYRIKDKSASEEYILPDAGTVFWESQTEVPAIHIMTDVGVHSENRERR